MMIITNMTMPQAQRHSAPSSAPFSTPTAQHQGVVIIIIFIAVIIFIMIITIVLLVAITIIIIPSILHDHLFLTHSKATTISKIPPAHHSHWCHLQLHLLHHHHHHHHHLLHQHHLHKCTRRPRRLIGKDGSIKLRTVGLEVKIQKVVFLRDLPKNCIGNVLCEYSLAYFPLNVSLIGDCYNQIILRV